MPAMANIYAGPTVTGTGSPTGTPPTSPTTYIDTSTNQVWVWPYGGSAWALVAGGRTVVGTFGDGVATSFTLTHNLASTYVDLAVFNTATGAEVEVAITARTSNALTVQTNSAPAAGAYSYLIAGN